MKIGLMSDSHDAVHLVEKAVKVFLHFECQYLFHAGDFVSPFAFQKMECFPGPVYSVFGNNEGEKPIIRQIASNFPEWVLEDEILETKIGTCRIAMKHRDKGVRSLAHSGDFDYVFYGHTHRVDVSFERNVHIVNPGETCGYLTGNPTVSVIDLDQGHVEILRLHDF